MQYSKIEQFLAFAILNINLKLRRTTDDLKMDILYTMRKNTKIRLSQRYSWVEKKYNERLCDGTYLNTTLQKPYISNKYIDFLSTFSQNIRANI